MKKTTPGLNLFIIALLVCGSFSCKSKKTDDKEKFFPVLSFLQSQAKLVDTSLYTIKKLVVIDSLRTDTLDIHRDQFREEARDFFELPDLSASKYESRYEETEFYDDVLDRVLITCLPKKPEKELIQRQEVVIKPSLEGDKVTSVIISTLVDNKDSVVRKNLLWNVDKNFQVTSIRQLNGQPETITTYKVVWNE